MKYFIAIDGGGSTTEIVLFTETGNIIHGHKGVGGNPTDVGTDEAVVRMKKCMEKIMPYTSSKITSLYGGIAGVIPNGDIFSTVFREEYPIEKIRIEDDGFNVISSTIGRDDGCGMVCGTGSSLFVRIQGEQSRHIGGKGYLIDTGGSGFELGREAIRMAFRAMDGRCKSTILTDIIADISGEPVTDLLIPTIHKGGRSYIATFASAVFQGRKIGDWACDEIFEKGATLMADLTYAAEQYFNDRFTVVMGGGIVANYPEYVQAIKEKASPRAIMMLQDAPPVYGAATEAMWQAGLEVTPLFKQKFLADYTELEHVGITTT